MSFNISNVSASFLPVESCTKHFIFYIIYLKFYLFFRLKNGCIFTYKHLTIEILVIFACIIIPRNEIPCIKQSWEKVRINNNKKVRIRFPISKKVEKRGLIIGRYCLWDNLFHFLLYNLDSTWLMITLFHKISIYDAPLHMKSQIIKKKDRWKYPCNNNSNSNNNSR
jgi:hypothetical protein